MVKHTQTIRRLLPTNCLGVFDHIVGLTLKGLRSCQTSVMDISIDDWQILVTFLTTSCPKSKSFKNNRYMFNKSILRCLYSSILIIKSLFSYYLLFCFKGTVMQILKALINDRYRVSKVLRRFCIPTVYSFAVIYP